MDTPHQILRLAKAYSEATGLDLSKVSRRLFNSSSRLAALEAGGDLNTRTADAAFAALNDWWPDETPWPADIDRPSSTPKAGPAVAAAVSPASSLSSSISEVTP